VGTIMSAAIYAIGSIAIPLRCFTTDRKKQFKAQFVE
jgi:hypothetical protein